MFLFIHSILCYVFNRLQNVRSSSSRVCSQRRHGPEHRRFEKSSIQENDSNSQRYAAIYSDVLHTIRIHFNLPHTSQLKSCKLLVFKRIKLRERKRKLIMCKTSIIPGQQISAQSTKTAGLTPSTAFVLVCLWTSRELIVVPPSLGARSPSHYAFPLPASRPWRILMVNAPRAAPARRTTSIWPFLPFLIILLQM